MDFLGAAAGGCRVPPLYLAKHHFLLKNLPHEEEPHRVIIEQKILKNLNQIVTPLCHRLSLTSTAKTLQTWKKIQDDRWQALHRRLTEVKRGENVCLYVRKQNSTILFTKLNETHTRVVTFRSSLPNETITGTCGSLKVTFPETLDVVPTSSLLLSPCFSKQLTNLTENICPIAMPKTKKAGMVHVETREPSHPYMISDFLVSMLCPVESLEQFGDVADIKKMAFEKKLRDQVNLRNSELPFRRSGLWMSAKVVLQLGLQEEMKSKEEAYLTYKIAILEVLRSLAAEYAKEDATQWDICGQMMAKLARRAKKLTELKTTENLELTRLMEEMLHRTYDTIHDIYVLVSEQWKTTVSTAANSCKIAPVTRDGRKWSEDCVHNINDLTAYLNGDRSPLRTEASDNLSNIDPVILTSTVTLDSLLVRRRRISGGKQDVHLNDGSVWIYQVEWFVRHGLSSEQPCGKIYNLMSSYFEKTFNLYGMTYADPVYYSRFAITILKFVAVLDEIAVRQHPLLKSYKTGIQPEMFENLLIPEKCDMQLVESLQDYFFERNDNAGFGYWLESGFIEGRHFAVQFAQRNYQMMALKRQILNQMEEDISTKQWEFQSAKAACDELQRQISRSTCTNTWDSYYQKSFHNSECGRCGFESELADKRISVKRYQRPLPPGDHLRDAVVFELIIPQELAVLREGVLLLLENVLGHSKSLLPKVDAGKIFTKWTDFCELQLFSQTGHQKRCHLGSTNKDMLTAHYGRKNPDVVELTEWESAFIWENGLNCVQYRTDAIGHPPANPFTMKISQAGVKDAKEYDTLQFALDPSRATENEAIASQYKCHQNVATKEFILFGSVRCGHRIQLRNLYAGIASKVLSLEKEPVVQLIMQALWELGPGNREILEDLEKSKPFASAFLELLSASGEENATNWSNPLQFLSLVVIALRIVDINDDPEVKVSASKILQRFREILYRWFVKLEELLVKNAEPTERNMLVEFLVKSAISCAFTFNVSCKESMPYILKDPGDVTYFLHTISRLHHLVVRENILGGNWLSGFLKNLLRHARHAIPLNLQEYLHEILSKPEFNRALPNFVCCKWDDAKTVSKIPTFFHSGNAAVAKKRAYQAQYQVASGCHQVCVDILRGTFFVDGYPPSVLPEKIIRDPLYQSFFRRSEFRVQRDSRTFKTTDKYRGLHFEFIEASGGRLIIRQLSSEEHWFELLPPPLLQDNVPHDLIQNYTHWFNSKTKAVHFRRPSSSDTEENMEDDTDYVLVSLGYEFGRLSEKWHLCKYPGSAEKYTCFLLSINSVGFVAISNNLRKLEYGRNIHVRFDIKEKKIIASLWRLGLSFSLNHQEGLLYCDYYPGYYIPISQNGGQNLETLVGLQSGLVLEKRTEAEVCGKKKLFLIQHGNVKISHAQGHQIVCVETEASLRSPAYFVFEVDQILNRLRCGSNKSAWLYLALLHGATSSPFLDPFTQLTGTESAMFILQSGFVWSVSPYNFECLATLTQIVNLSPKYTYYPENLRCMQTVQWPEGLSSNSYAAYDGYAIIVQRLLQDSQRLSGLFPDNSGVGSHPQGNWDLSLCRRSYYRNINLYNKVAHLSPEFTEHPGNLNSCPVGLPSRLGICNANELATFAKFREEGIPFTSSDSVASLIMIKSQPLPCNVEDKLTAEYIPVWLTAKLRDNWLQLYALALNSKLDNVQHELTLILGSILYSGRGPLNQLLNLHNISIANAQLEVAFPEPLKSLTNSDYIPLDDEFGSDDISSILREAADKPPSEKGFDTHGEYLKSVEEFESLLKAQLTSSTKEISRYYQPAKGIRRLDLQRIISSNRLLNFTDSVLEGVNANFTRWFNNHNLKLFITEVDKFLAPFKRRTSDPELKTTRQGQSVGYHRPTPDITDRWLKSGGLAGSLTPDACAQKIFTTGQLSASGQSLVCTRRKDCVNVGKRFLKELHRLSLGTSPVTKALDRAGLNVRLAPVTLLRDHLPEGAQRLREGDCYVGAIAVIWAHLKRLNRIFMYGTDQRKYGVELARELETRPCENWRPSENPEWLLLELELDITIRAVQVDVARRMMNMPNGKNGVMQLNMGEGKTSVIIPMIVATMSTQRNLLCRVTVLNSIFASNHTLLAYTIGGLLNKRLYSIPCSRDLPVPSYLYQIDHLYKECLRLGGAVITLPEFRLSFRLQIYNNFLQDGMDAVGLKFQEIESWLRKHCRDIIDESDEILNVKYQLIYTTGKQIHLDGGSMRWQVCQKLHEYLPKVAAQLLQKYGTQVIEFDPKKATKNPEMFTHLRILSEDCKKDLYELVADGILEGRIKLFGRIFRGEEKKVVKEFLMNDDICYEDHTKLFQIEDMAAEKRQMLLLVSGYLRRGILFAALKKRCRVEYGVKKPKPGTSAKLMAVPFRAKDVAAERTEYGHPDMAIVLTHLSYYQSGLSDEQLMQCFKILETTVTAPETVYNSWIKSIPAEKVKSDTLKTYKGINLKDYEQRTEHLFPLLRYHKNVIDFWLENLVFPKECKQFPGKVVTNAWDLVYERNVHPTTGFSGTNDTSLLLPAQVTQQDLKALEETNSKMEGILQRKENQWERSLEMGEGCQKVLGYMIQGDLRVLIDSGALMLELGNEAIAELWLKLDPTLEAVVYFSESGEMVVKVRPPSGYKKEGHRGKDQPLTLSPFKDCMDNCAIYLDDQHTRGTDIKLPTSFKACVTIGSGMRRDKLIQACMRMRKLGKGQSVHFYLSHEVDTKIRHFVKHHRKLSVIEIIDWTKGNSKQFEEDGLVYWATNAKTYAKNLGADDLFEMSTKSKEDCVLLGERCEDPDAQVLDQMYGTFHQRTLVTDLIPAWFSQAKNKLDCLSLPQTFPKVVETFDKIEADVLKKCRRHIPQTTYFHSMLEEEQEKELEPEQEVEEERYRPPKEIPLQPELKREMVECVKNMTRIGVMNGISRLSDIFNGTTIRAKMQLDGWGDQWYATGDFIKVVYPNNSRDVNAMDSFLRTVHFFVSYKYEATTSALLLSLHEVNGLIADLRQRNCMPGTTLHMVSGRWMDGQPIFVNDVKLQLPLRPKAATLEENFMAPLLIAVGNMYFGSPWEQMAFANFLGLRLRPWTEEEERAFQEKQITSSGFVLPNCPELREGCVFQKDPIEMVMGILRIRNDVLKVRDGQVRRPVDALRDTDHVVAVLNTCTGVFPTDDGED